jgi:hypothetical protein
MLSGLHSLPTPALALRMAALLLPSRAGQAELAEGGGFLSRAWSSLEAAPPWTTGLGPAKPQWG